VTGLFPTAGHLKHGYNRHQVDAFFDQARSAYEKPESIDAVVTPLDVRRASFDLRRAGYSTGAVDAALDRLEIAFAERTREVYVKHHGQDAWMAHLADRAKTLYPRLRRPAGDRFAHPGAFKHGYAASEVDSLLDRLTSYFDSGTPLTPAEVRSVLFSRKAGRKAYDERTVDAYLARAVEILLGVH
jgi:DivIVA domain-containing protein